MFGIVLVLPASNRLRKWVTLNNAKTLFSYSEKDEDPFFSEYRIQRDVLKTFNCFLFCWQEAHGRATFWLPGVRPIFCVVEARAWTPGEVPRRRHLPLLLRQVTWPWQSLDWSLRVNAHARTSAHAPSMTSEPSNPWIDPMVSIMCTCIHFHEGHISCSFYDKSRDQDHPWIDPQV